jgi:hypothetical protein
VGNGFKTKFLYTQEEKKKDKSERPVVKRYTTSLLYAWLLLRFEEQILCLPLDRRKKKEM